MEVLFRSLHNLDLNKDEPIPKEIPSDFNEYIQEYINFAVTENRTSRMYTVPDAHTTVMNGVCCISSKVSTQSVDEETISFASSIARKLLTIEQEVQRRIGHLTDVQRGSIVQAMTLENGEYRYVIAKVEHSEWYDGDTLKKNFGFPGENKRVWKSAVIDLTIDDGEVVLGNVKVFSKTEAQYWANSFLEVKEANTDKVNTENVLNAIHRELKRSVKEKSPYDYANLKGALYTALQSDQMIEYDQLIDSMLEHYSPTEDSIDKEQIRTKLKSYAGTGKFDTQFHADPAVVKKNSKKKYRVNDYINLYIDESSGQQLIKGQINPATGEKELVIPCDDESTFAMFYNS